MPLIDRPEFLAWLEARMGRPVGLPHGDIPPCSGCGRRMDHFLGSPECLVCLAEQFGAETAELWLAEAVAGVIHAAADPPALGRILGSAVVCIRDLSGSHVPPEPA